MVSKYKAEKIVVDGYKFDSKVESKYYEYLKDLKSKGLIENFELQPQYTLQPKFKNNFGENIRAIIYKADFLVYWIDGTREVVDIKGMATPEAKIKRKMFQCVYPNEFLNWIVWQGGQWQDYYTVIKDRSKRKRAKQSEAKSQ